jgi:hypothetical protein
MQKGTLCKYKINQNTAKLLVVTTNRSAYPAHTRNEQQQHAHVMPATTVKASVHELCSVQTLLILAAKKRQGPSNAIWIQ